MTRDDAMDAAEAHFRSGTFLEVLGRRVAMATDSQDPACAPVLRAYLDDEMRPSLEAMGFGCSLVSPEGSDEPFLLASRQEGEALPTVLLYGHGDVVPGMEGRWSPGLEPWSLHVSGDRIHGRGSADNKGQHAINLAALDAVLRLRGGRLGFNVRVLIEMGEERGSPGLASLCREHRAALAADVLVASDGPRLSADRPTLFGGARGGLRLHLDCAKRDGAHHSGNWGGLLANPATMVAAAIASLVDGRGRLLLDALRPPPMPPSVRQALAGLQVRPGEGEPALDEGWGEPGLGPAERVYGFNTLEVLAMEAGDASAPVNAIPGRARAVLQLRFVVGTRPAAAIAEAVRAHLDARGLGAVTVRADNRFAATRTDPDDPWMRWAAGSILASTGEPPAVLPNIGGSLPNDVFADGLGLPTLWIPHSYPGCRQHAPDEHLLAPVAVQGLRIMAGLFWDLGEGGPAGLRRPVPGREASLPDAIA